MNTTSPDFTSDRNERRQASREPLVIGLVNNMGDAALQTTEQQFKELLAAAAEDAEVDVRLRLFSFPELIRGEGARAYITSHYEPIGQLWAGELDGLIVTGAEPRTATLPEEVYWPSFTRLIDLANEIAAPTVWSCLAAHAAVLYLDRIERHRFGEKLSGLFRCTTVGDNPLTAGLPASWHVPHSRLNTLDPAQLLAAGYDIVSFSDDAGADTFTVRRRAPFVFFQGHPEYDAGALFREYRRDVGRFLAGTMDRYPEMPQGYFDDETARALDEFRARAQRERTRELLEAFPEIDPREKFAHSWRDVAVRLYRNWLASILSERSSDALLTAGGSIPAPST